MLQQTGYTPPTVAPGAERPSLLGFLRAMVSNPVGAIPAAAYREPIVVLRMTGATVAFVSAPELLEEVLVRRVADFPKSDVDDRILRPAFGDSLLTAHGEEWRWKRRLAAPHFAPAALARSVPEMVAPFRALAQTWRARNSPAPLDVAPAMTSATFEVIRRVLFSSQDDAEFDAIPAAIDDYLGPISWPIALASLKVPAWAPHPGAAQIRRARDRMRAAVGAVVAARRRSPGSYRDLCSDLMRGQDPETKRPLSDRDLVDMLLTLVAAGHETSANGLTWALLCLAEQPALQAELASEVARVVGDRPVAAADLGELKAVEAFLKESMRLLPPVPLLTRRTTQTESLGGQTLKAGTILFIPIFAIQRHERLWPDPGRFDPGRFLGEGAKRMPRTAYMPFGAGPRICVGGAFAMMEMVAGLATLLQGVRFAVGGGAPCEPIQRITLRPKGGMPLAVTAAGATPD